MKTLCSALLYSLFATSIFSAQLSEKWVEIWKKDAEQDYTLAQVYLGIAHFNGIGVAKNRKEAEKWLHQAAQKGNFESILLLDALNNERSQIVHNDKQPVDSWSLLLGGKFTMGEFFENDIQKSPFKGMSGDSSKKSIGILKLVDKSYKDKSKPHDVILSPFYISQKETTLSEWTTVRNWGISNGYIDLPAGISLKNINNPYEEPGIYPVRNISWYDAVKWCNAASERAGLEPVYYTSGITSGNVYKTGKINPLIDCTKNGYRLPSEAEWELAARGGIKDKRYPWGNYISHKEANYYANIGYFRFDRGPSGPHPDYTYSYPPISPVGAFRPNGFGIYDISGNVAEWCNDWFGIDYYSTSQVIDPLGPENGSARVVRGGSCQDNAWLQKVSTRRAIHPFSLNNVFPRHMIIFNRPVVGFRLASTFPFISYVKEVDLRNYETLQKLAENGDVDAMHMLGLSLSNGVGISRNEETGAKWYRKAAELGHVQAQTCLAWNLEKGIGVTQNGEDAIKWYLKAAEQGDARAQFNLGMSYANGNNVQKDEIQSMKWYLKSAEQGILKGQVNVSVLYGMGKGVPKNNKLAYMWADIAAANGAGRAKGIKALLRKDMTRAQIAEAQKLSREWMAKRQD